MKAFRLALPCMLISSIVGCTSKNEQITPPPSLPYVSTYDVLNQQIVERVKNQFGNPPDAQAIVSIIDFDIGTLIRVDSKTPINYDACLPDKPLKDYSAPSLFPAATLSSNAAAGIGLDQGVIGNLVSAGADLSGNEKVVFSVKGATYKQLSDDDFEAIIKRPKCRAAIERKPALFVRGYVQGQRDFQIYKLQKAGLKLSINKFGNLSANVDANRLITLTDSKKESLVMIITKVSVDKNKKTSFVNYPIELKGVSKISLDRKLYHAPINTKILILSPGTGTSEIVNPDK
uniref:hypothetical protein n=1 Tax=Klebsiella sp. TaxID=576 RepID=UPI0031D12396